MRIGGDRKNNSKYAYNNGPDHSDSLFILFAIFVTCGSTLIGLLKSKLCLLSSCNGPLHGILFSVNFNHLDAHIRHLKSCFSITLNLIFYLSALHDLPNNVSLIYDKVDCQTVICTIQTLISNNG
jgi:hypothetical protein